MFNSTDTSPFSVRYLLLLQLRSQLFKTPQKPEILLRTKFHEFVDDKEKDSFVKFTKNADTYTGIMYTYIQEPIFETKFIFNSLYDLFKHDSEIDNTDVIMYYIFYDTNEDKYGFRCTKVLNNDEYGSKHYDLYKSSPENHYYVTAGEMKLTENGEIEFNPISGTFTDQSKRKMYSVSYEFIHDTVANWNTVENKSREQIIQTYIYEFVEPLYKKEFQEECMNIVNNHFYVFKYNESPISKEVLFNNPKPFINYKLNITNNISPYYILVNDENHKYLMTLFEFGTSILLVFYSLKKMNPHIVKVNCALTDISNQVVKTNERITKNMIANASNTPEINDTLSMYNGVDLKVIPQFRDKKIAEKIFKHLQVNNYKHKQSITTDPPELHAIDVLDLEGKTYLLQTYDDNIQKIIEKKLVFESILYMANSIVYEGNMDGKKVIIKFLSIYYNIMHEFNNNTSSYLVPDGGTFVEQSDFYEETVFEFVLPNTAFWGTIVPHRGTAVDLLELKDRIPLYKEFKWQYIARFIKHGIRLNPHSKSEKIKILYRDVKPENVTMDENGKFHLIDRDQFSQSEWFGPGKNVAYSVLFSIAALFYWFKTDIRPFEGRSLDQRFKLEWAQNLQDQEISRIIDNLNNVDLNQVRDIRRTLTSIFLV